MDFPRIPFPANPIAFNRLADLGEKLVEFHLLESSKLKAPACKFEGQGDLLVCKGHKQGLRYDSAAARVYINSGQYFGPVSVQIWEYHVGGYQVCRKWLEDRQERRLDLDEIRTYCHIVTAIKQTIALEQEIAVAYTEARDNWLIDIFES